MTNAPRTTLLAALLLLLPFTLALPSPHQERYHPFAQAAGHGALNREAHARRAAQLSEPAGQAGQRMVRRKRACIPKSQGNSSVTSAATAAVDAAIKTTTTTSSSVATSSVTTISSTASAPSSTGATSDATAGTLMGRLFPVSTKDMWTTSTDSSSALSFNAALTPLTAGKLPSQNNAPDGSSALVASYPGGIYGLTGSGYSFYTQGQHNSVDVTSAREVLFSYSAYFPDGFDFVKGGKMPGLYGGTSLAEAKSCSGGRQNDRDECFSARMMWRTNGMGEFYNYFPTSIQQTGGYCQTAPMSVCDTVYGDSIGRGSFSWSTGKWTTVAMRLKLNDVGSSNGEQQLWVDGTPIMDLTGLQIIVKDAKIYGIMAQTFFGGSDSSWASPTDQNVWFKDWSLAVLS